MPSGSSEFKNSPQFGWDLGERAIYTNRYFFSCRDRFLSPAAGLSLLTSCASPCSSESVFRFHPSPCTNSCLFMLLEITPMFCSGKHQCTNGCYGATNAERHEPPSPTVREAFRRIGEVENPAEDKWRYGSRAKSKDRSKGQ